MAVPVNVDNFERAETAELPSDHGGLELHRPPLPPPA